MVRPRDPAAAELARQLGLRVRRCRDAMSPAPTQEQLAHLVGVDRTYIGRVERGEANVTIYNLVRIANALDVDPADLTRGLHP